MSNRPENTAGLARYKRVMVTKFNGTCTFCQQPTEAMSDFAAVGTTGGFVPVCRSCALSVPAQVKAYVDRIGKIQDELTDEQIASLSVPDNLGDVIGGRTTEAVALETLAAVACLMVDVQMMVGPKTAADIGKRPNKYSGDCAKCGQDVPEMAGYCDKVNGRFAAFHLSCPEVKDAPPVKSTPEVEVEVGKFYAKGDQIVSLRMTQKSRQTVGYLLTDEGDWDYAGKRGVSIAESGDGEVDPEVIAMLVCLRQFGALPGSDELRQMALDFANDHSVCMFCGHELNHEFSDPRLGGVGYGPTCAAKYNLPHGKDAQVEVERDHDEEARQYQEKWGKAINE